MRERRPSPADAPENPSGGRDQGPRRSPRDVWGGVAFLLLAIAAFAYGWRVTRIDLGELVTKAHLVRPLVRDLLRPEVLERVPRVQEATVPVSLAGPAPPAPPARTPWRLEASHRTVRVGQEVELRGQGFAPHRPGRLVWRDATGAPSGLLQFTTDSQGGFRVRVQIPDTLGDRGELVAVVELAETTWRPSETLRLVAERMARL